jgi:transcription termination factor Rho
MLTEFIPSTTKQHAVNHDPYINPTTIKSATPKDYDNITGTVDVSSLDDHTLQELMQIDKLNNEGATLLLSYGQSSNLQ